MRAMTVEPGRAASAALTDLPSPAGVGDEIADGVAVGICGTDLEIAAGLYGLAPTGSSRLVLGHESLGRVVAAPPGGDLVPGDLVVGIVRRPDPVPCRTCAAGAWDMCLNGRYTERGIKGLDGYGAEQWRVEPEFAIRVDPALGGAAVLVEPTSVVAKAWDHIERIVARAPLAPRRVLVAGAGPIGLLAALLATQRGLVVDVLDRVVDGPKPDLVADLGARYHTGNVTDLPKPDIVLECTGVSSVVLDVISDTARRRRDAATSGRPALRVRAGGTVHGVPKVLQPPPWPVREFSLRAQAELRACTKAEASSTVMARALSEPHRGSGRVVGSRISRGPRSHVR